MVTARGVGLSPSDTADLPNLAGGKPASADQLILTRRMRLITPFISGESLMLVDFGCGNGAQTLTMAALVPRVMGVDVDATFLTHFAASAQEQGLADRATGHLIIDNRIPLADEQADVVTSFTVLEHVPDEGTALAEMHRVLKPGGCLIISVPNRWWIFETHGCDLPLLPWNRVPLVSWWPKTIHDRWARARNYRLREIVAMVSAAGFVVEESFRMTAPMDMIRHKKLQHWVRENFFRPDRAVFPFQATENFVVASKR